MKMRSPVQEESWPGVAVPGRSAATSPYSLDKLLSAHSGIRRLKTLRGLSSTQRSDLVAQMMQDCPTPAWPDGFHVPLAPLTLLITETQLPRDRATPPGGAEVPPVWGRADVGGYRERLRLLADALVPAPPDMGFEDRLALAGLLDLSQLPKDALEWAATVVIRHLRPELILLFNLDAPATDRVTSALAASCPVLASAWPEALELYVEPAGQLEGWSLRGKGGPSVAVIPTLPVSPDEMPDTRFWYWEVCTLVGGDIRRAFRS